MWMFWRYVKERTIAGKVIEFEVKNVEIECIFDRKEEDEHPVDMLSWIKFQWRLHRR